MKRWRLAIAASHVIQYQDPFFRLLAEHPAIDLEVLYCSRAGADIYRDRDMQTSLQWDIPLLQGYRHRFLKNFGFGGGYTRLINPGLLPTILTERYDAVLFFMGWGSISSLFGIGACRMSATPFLFYGDSSHPPPTAGLRGTIRAAFLRSIFRLASGFTVSGVLNAAYYRHYGADPSTFFSLPWAIDNDRFAAAARFEPGERETLRARFEIAANQIAIVYSAKLVPRKDPRTLLEAVARIEQRERAVVIFLGHGELREELERFAAESGINARFPGFVNQADLPKHYAMGDIFVLPSLVEPRGAVINEAMACGLPVVVTDRCGSIGDIVVEGQNAFVYPAGDATALASILHRLIVDDGLRHHMGERSREIIQEWSYSRGVRGLVEAMETVGRR